MNAGQGNLLDKAFDEDLARQEGERGMALALANEFVKKWRVAAREWVVALPRGTVVTSDSLVRAVGLPTESDLSAKCNNALGGMFAGLHRSGILAPYGHRTSTRVSNNGREIRVWVRT